MAQRAIPCGISLGICATRITTLDPVTGCVESAADNSFVLDNAMTFTFTPNIETGIDLSLIGGCGCPIAKFKGDDFVKRYDLTLTVPNKTAAFESILTDGGVLYDDSTTPVPVGASFPSGLLCGDTKRPVAIEFWTKHIVNDAQDSALPWIHFVFPFSQWVPGAQTAQNDFMQPDFSGFSRTNSCWGDGPYSDGPESIYGASAFTLETGGWFYTPEDPPAADCDFASVVPSS